MNLWTFFEDDAVPARTRKETEEVLLFCRQNEQQAAAATPESSYGGTAAAAAHDAHAPAIKAGGTAHAAEDIVEAAATAADAAATDGGQRKGGGGRGAREASPSPTHPVAAWWEKGRVKGRNRSRTAMDEEGDVAADVAVEESYEGEAAGVVRKDAGADSVRAEPALSAEAAAAEAAAAEGEMRLCDFMSLDEEVEEKELQQQQSSRSSTVQEEAEADGGAHEVEGAKEGDFLLPDTETIFNASAETNTLLTPVESHVDTTAALPRRPGRPKAAAQGAKMGGILNEATAAEEFRRAQETTIAAGGTAEGVAAAAAGTAAAAGELAAAARERRDQRAEGEPGEDVLQKIEYACSDFERKEVELAIERIEEGTEQKSEEVEKEDHAWRDAKEKELLEERRFSEDAAERRHRRSSSSSSDSSTNSSHCSSSHADSNRGEKSTVKNDRLASSGYKVINDCRYSNSCSRREEIDNSFSSSTACSYVATTPAGHKTHANSFAPTPVSTTALQDQEQQEDQWQEGRQQQELRQEQRQQQEEQQEEGQQGEDEVQQEEEEQEREEEQEGEDEPQQQQEDQQQQPHEEEEGQQHESELETRKESQHTTQVTGALPFIRPSSLLFACAAVRGERDAAATAAAGDALCSIGAAAARAGETMTVATAEDNGSEGRRGRREETHQQPVNNDKGAAAAATSSIKRGTYETATTADVVVIQTSAAQCRFSPEAAAAEAAVAACDGDAAAVEGGRGLEETQQQQQQQGKEKTCATSIAPASFRDEGRQKVEVAAGEKESEEKKQIDAVRAAEFFEQLQQKQPATAAVTASNAAAAAPEETGTAARGGEAGPNAPTEEAKNAPATAPATAAAATAAGQNHTRAGSSSRSRRRSVASEEEKAATSDTPATCEAATPLPPQPQQQLQQQLRRGRRGQEDEEEEESQQLRQQESNEQSRQNPSSSKFKRRSSSAGSNRSIGRVMSSAAPGNYPPSDSHKQTEMSGEAWFQRRRHVFIFTFSGKPVYSRYALEGGLASLMGTLSAIVSKMENFFFLRKSPPSSDSLRYIAAGEKRFVFLRKGPFYLVSVHDAAAANVQQIKSLLFLMHRQLLCILTKGVEDTLYKRPSFDVSPLLGGTDGVLHKLLSQYFSSMLSVWLAAATSFFFVSSSANSRGFHSSSPTATGAQGGAAAGRKMRFDAAFFLSSSSSSSSSSAAAALAAAAAVSAAGGGGSAALASASQKRQKGHTAAAGGGAETEAAAAEVEAAAEAEAAAAARESIEQQSIEALTAFEPLPLNATMRHIACNMLKQSPAEQVLANVLLADDRVVAIATAKYFTFQPTDLVLLTNFVSASPALRQAESWTPFCLPGFNDRAFVYMYVRFITPHVSFVSLSLKSDGDQFYLLSTHCTRTFALLSNTGCLAAIERSRLYSPYSLPGSLWGSLGLLHVALLLPQIHQFFSSAFSSDLIASDYHQPIEHILQLYVQCEECVYHAKLPTHSYLETEREKVYVWRTHDFHFYAAVPSWTDLSTEVVEELARWVLEQQPFLFLTHIPTITPAQNS